MKWARECIRQVVRRAGILGEREGLEAISQNLAAELASFRATTLLCSTVECDHLSKQNTLPSDHVGSLDGDNFPHGCISNSVSDQRVDWRADTGARLGAMCFYLLLAYLSSRAFWGLGNRKESGRRATQACLILLSGILCYAGLNYGHPFDAPERVDWRPLLVTAVVLSIATYLSLSKAAKIFDIQRWRRTAKRNGVRCLSQ